MSAPVHRTPWPYWLGALSVAICTAESAYKAAAGSERLAQFTAGSITWRNASKSEDYALLVGFMAGFALAWIALVMLERRVEARLGSAGVRMARALVAYVCLPFVIWVSGLVLGQGDTRELVWLSTFGIVLSAALMFAASGQRMARTAGASRGDLAGILLLLLVFGALSALIGAFAMNRLSALARESFIWTGSPPPWFVAGVGALVAMAIGVWAAQTVGPRLDRRLQSAIVASQLVLPWAFLMVMPTPWASGTAISHPYPTAFVFAIALALVITGTIDVIRRLPRWRPAQAGEPLAAVSPVALAGALFFVKFAPVAVGYFHPDDYHFGELLLPWWTMTVHGAVPFWDYVPSRGLINYLNGAISAIVFDGTTAGLLAAPALAAAVVLLVGLTSLAWVIGPLPAAGAFLMMPVWTNVNHIDILNTAALAALWAAYTRASSTAWLCLWAGISAAVFVAAPAQGTAVILATVPLATWRFARACRDEPSALLRVSGVVAILALLTLWLTPVGLVVRGAIRYGVENSAVGAAAHAVEWSRSAGATIPLNRWLWEAARTAWMAVGCASVALLVWNVVRGDRERRGFLLLVGIPIFILAAVFIYRAAGRIDAGHVSRLGLATVWMLTLLLPLLLYAAWGGGRWPAIITLSVAGGGLIAPVLGPVSLEPVLTRAFETVPAPSDPTEATRKGLPQLGQTAVPATILSRLLAIDAVLDALLDPDETYLDLTNRNAHYFYLDRRLPIESGAFYNLPDERQQLRAIGALETEKVPVVLAWAESSLHDGGPPSYRTYAIYRYLIWRYVPVKIGDLIFLVRPDRRDRVVGRFGQGADFSDPEGLLDAVFRRADLHGLPASWGASWLTLESLVVPVRGLDVYGSPEVEDVVVHPNHRFRVTGGSPALTWRLTVSPIRGKDAGLLTFRFACLSGGDDARLEVGWAAAGEPLQPATTVRFTAAGRVAVPLDASPRWLLARSIVTLRISLLQPSQCTEFSLEDPRLWQRRVVAATDPY